MVPGLGLGLRADGIDDAYCCRASPGEEDERVVEKPFSQEQHPRICPRDNNERADYVRDEDADEGTGEGGDLFVLGVICKGGTGVLPHRLARDLLWE